MDMDLRHKAWEVRTYDIQQEIGRSHLANGGEHRHSVVRSAVVQVGHVLVSLGTHLESLEQNEKGAAFIPARGH